MSSQENASRTNLKKLALATLAGGGAMWILAGIWHTLIAAAFYSAETHASHEGTGIILVAYMVLGVMMAYLYRFFYRGGRPVLEGLKFGLLVGLLWVFPHELAMAGAHGESILYVFKNAGWHLVEQGLGGMIVGLIYGRNMVAAAMKATPHHQQITRSASNTASTSCE